MEKITDKQVKKVEVIYDCSEFSSDTPTRLKAIAQHFMRNGGTTTDI